MKVRGKNHVYDYVPDYHGNRKLPAAEQIVINCTVVTVPDMDVYKTAALNASRKFATDKAHELNTKRYQDLLATHFKGVTGLEIEGLEGELTFELFYAEAPPELVNEYIQVVLSAELLTDGEQKNFLPASDGA